jgi:tripartite ATP-independent transporter DctP family solute receptor
MSKGPRILALLLAALLVLAACGSDSDETTTGAGGSETTTTSAGQQDTTTTAAGQQDTTTTASTQEEVELVLAHSYQEGQPQVECGANVIRDVAEAANVGLTITIFGASSLGGDADRIESVIAGDIDLDIQGASALAAVYEPISVADGAFVFDDSDHLYRYFTGEASTPLKDGFYEKTGVRILGAWNTGARQFTANIPIREPADLTGLRMRFPPSPSFLLNAAAMGAEPVEVAYEELYLALQQGTVDGQENPIVNIAASNLQEVQDYISLSSHQLSSNLVIVGPVWDTLSAEQQQALADAVEQAMVQEPQCAAESETEIMAEWRESGELEIIEDVDRDAFRDLAEPYLRDQYNADQIAVLEAIRSTAN